MAETDLHRKLMVELLHALEQHFLHDSKVYISGNIFMYYLDPMGLRKHVSPDIMVIRGVDKKERRIYKEENWLRLYDPKSGERLRTPAESEAERLAAEAEIAHLREELAKVSGEKK